MFYCYFYRILLAELLSEKSCKTSFFPLFFYIFYFYLLGPNLFFMIVNFVTYQFIGPHKFLNV